MDPKTVVPLIVLLVVGCPRGTSDPAPAAAGASASSPPPTPPPEPQPPPPRPTGCPSGSVRVTGEMCLAPEQDCVDWIDDPKLPYARCRRYSTPTRCPGPRRRVDVCIDRLEAAGPDGMPIADVSWTTAVATCESRGMRLCQEHEWTFACEGETGRPYPHGWTRRPEWCNHDIGKPLACGAVLCDHRRPVDDPELHSCSTPEGVCNLVGNIDEWVVLDRPHFSAKNGGRKMMSGLKGGWWGNLRNRCRPVTVDHDEHFHELQTGFRCCADPGGER